MTAVRLAAPKLDLTRETYFGVGKASNYAGNGVYDEGSATFAYPPALPADSFALQGPWALDYQGATADGDSSSIKMNIHAKNVYVVVGGTGSLTITRDGKIFLGTTMTAKEDLTNQIKDRISSRSDKTVFVKSDARAKYGDVVAAVDEIRSAGVDQLGLLTDKAHAATPPPTPPPAD